MEPLYVTRIAQYQAEVEWLQTLIHKNDVRSYLEIGGWYGGTLWAYGGALPKGSRIVCVDRPQDGERLASLNQCCDALRHLGYDVHLLIGDSGERRVIEEARRLGPYDLAFIDADHVLDAVRKDWANYAPMSRIVALHDINWKRPAGWTDWTSGRPINCPEFWEETKASGVRFEEARLDPSGRSNGIGVLWRS